LFEHKPPDVIKERISDDYLSQLNNVLTSVRGVNKTDVMTLTSNFGSLKRIAQAGPDEMSLLPGFGEVKVKRLREAFSQPFRTGSSTGTVGDARTMRSRKAAAALRAAEAGEELPDTLLDLERETSSSSKGKQRQNGNTPAAVMRGDRARDPSVDKFGLGDADEQAMWQAAEALERSGADRGSPAKDAGGDTSKPTAEAAEEGTGMSAALRAAAMWRDGGWKSNTVRPTARATNGPQPEPPKEKEKDESSAPSGLEKTAQEEPSLEDFENLTEEEQLAMAMKMSTGGD
jgi:Helix-hairpin-helix domain